MLVDEGLFLTFVLGKETYGFNAEQVYEITGIMNTTRVPHTPSYVRGVVNLRGKVVPIVDLRVRLGLKPRVRDKRTSIVVVKIERGEGCIAVGIEVDSVSEVSHIAAECISPPPSFGSHTASEFIHSVAKVDESAVLILDIDSILGHGNLLDSSASMGVDP